MMKMKLLLYFFNQIKIKIFLFFNISCYLPVMACLYTIINLTSFVHSLVFTCVIINYISNTMYVYVLLMCVCRDLFCVDIDDYNGNITQFTSLSVSLFSSHNDDYELLDHKFCLTY